MQNMYLLYSCYDNYRKTVTKVHKMQLMTTINFIHSFYSTDSTNTMQLSTIQNVAQTQSKLQPKVISLSLLNLTNNLSDDIGKWFACNAIRIFINETDTSFTTFHQITIHW